MSFEEAVHWLRPSSRAAWAARPVTPELRVEAQAFALLEDLAQLPLKADVHEAIRQREGVTQSVQQKALELAESNQDDPHRLNDASLAILRVSSAKPEDYQRALRYAEAACRLKSAGAAIASVRAGAVDPVQLSSGCGRSAMKWAVSKLKQFVDALIG